MKHHVVALAAAAGALAVSMSVSAQAQLSESCTEENPGAGSSGGFGPCVYINQDYYGGEPQEPGLYVVMTGSTGNSADAIDSTALSGYGVLATSSGNDGVHGISTASGYSGVAGVSSASPGNGVYGRNTAGGYGVEGVSTSTSGGTGVYGSTAAAGLSFGVFGMAANSSGAIGVWGQSTNGMGVNGIDTAGGIGVQGTSTSGWAVYGGSTYSDGGHFLGGSSGSAVAAENSSGGTGLYAATNWTGSTGNAITATAEGGYGIWAASATNYAGYFSGVVDITTGLLGAGVCRWGSCSVSDQRLKKNVEPLKGALDALVKLKGVTFEWKTPGGSGPDDHEVATGTQTGFIAQEVEQVFPRWVGENKEGFKTLDIPTKEMAALTVESIKALKAENDEFRARLSAVENGRVLPKAGGLLSSPAGGWAFGGLALAASLVITRRRRQDDRS